MLETVLRHRIRADVAPSNGYLAAYSCGELEVVASDPLALRYGIARTQCGLQSGYVEDFLGTQAPRFPWRILWPEDANCTPERVVELGFNAVMLDQSCACLESWKKLGIAVGTRLTESASDRNAWDFVLWESQLSDPAFSAGLEAADATFLELVEAEMRRVRGLVPSRCKLIFSLPCEDSATAHRQAEWMGPLCDRAPAGTFVAFPAFLENQIPHPFWDQFRKIRDPSATPLLPLLNVGSIGLGEGLWPVLPLSAIRYSLSQMQGAPFAGAIALTRHVPAGEGLLACGLWLAAQALWGGRSVDRLAEAWFAAKRPDFDYPHHAPLLEMAREVAVELGRLSKAKPALRAGGGYSPAHIELLAAKLRLLDGSEPSKTLPQGERAGFHDYLRYFCRDAWCLLYYHVDRLRLSVPGVPMAVEHSGGFWAQLTLSAARGIPSAANVTPLQSPRCKDEDSGMRRVFLENRNR